MRVNRADHLAPGATAPPTVAALTRPAATDAGLFVGLALVAAWGATVAGVPARLPLQGASWLTFLAVAVTPGYLLADMACRRLDLDVIQRLALAFPLSIAAMAVPGLTALVGHLTIRQLALGWALVVALLAIAWAIVRLLRREDGPPTPAPWARHELVLLVALIAAYLAIYPLLSLYKMDGDAYAVLAFTADALTGEPLNVTEPLLGSGYSPNVRMAGNQMLPLFHLWCYLARADHVQLIGSASRSMLALWALLSTYTLGREAGGGRRRIGLLAVSVQMLVYLAAPFYRGDSVSVFFFERTNADKFTVSVTMLPVTLALAIRHLRLGERATWVAAALCALAVSSVHALIAAMLALGLASFGALHLLLNLRRREAWHRVIALAALVLIGMAIPVAQLAMTLDTPLAPTYPQSLEGWNIAERTFRLLPTVEVKGLDLYGPLPDLAEVEAEDANTATNPFLIWRFAANMRRKRLIIFSLNRYISDPALVLEPPYLLSLLLLPLLLWRLPSRLGAQMALANALAVLFLLFNPLLTPIVGAMAVPWLLWRFVWLLPHALVIALVADQLIGLVARALTRLAGREGARGALRGWLELAALGACVVLLWPRIAVTGRELRSRPAGPVPYPTPQRLFARLAEETQGAPAMVLADENLSVTIPAFVGRAHVLAREVLTSELFPADRQDAALQRHIDQYRFFHSPWLTDESVAILARNAVRYVAVVSGSDLDLQLRAAPQWFEWLVDDAGYALHAVHRAPEVTGAVEANTLMAAREWAPAAERYRAALAQDADDLLAAVGLARASRLMGRFDPAIDALRGAVGSADSAGARFLLGQLHAERGEWEPAIAALTSSVEQAPRVPRFHASLGSACLAAGRIACAEEHFRAAVDAARPRDAAWYYIALAGLWDQEGQAERALALYDRAAAERPDWPTRLLLASIFQTAGEFERAEAQLQGLLADNPHSADARLAMASLLSAHGDTTGALSLLEEALALQARQLLDSDLTHLTLAQTLAGAGRVDDARREIERTLLLRPYSAAAYTLLANLRRDQGQTAEAVAAYRRALDIDPRQVAPYIALGEELRRAPASSQEVIDLLQEATRRNPSSARLYLYLGDQRERRGDVPAAITAYHLAADLLQPDTILTGVVDRSRIHGRAIAYARLAAAYEDQAQVDAAVSYYRAAAAAAPDARLSVLLGDALRRQGDLPAAAEAFHLAIAREPGYVDGYTQLADLLEAQGDTVAALWQRDRAALAIAGAAEGELLAAAGDTGRYDLTIQQPGVQRGSDETLAIATAAYSAIRLALDPMGESADATGGLAALDGLARLYVDSGEVELAIQVYRDEVAYGEEQGWPPSRLARYHASIGSLLLLQDEPGQALHAYRRAGELDPSSAAALVGMGNALTRLGRESEALEQFRLAVDVAPGLPEPHLALAAALRRLADGEASLAVQRSVAEAHPGHVPAARALGLAWQERGEWTLAEDALQQALAVAPGKPEIHVDLAAIYAAQARHAEAEAALRAAIALNFHEARALLRLGELLARLGRHAEAIDAYRDALTASPTDWRPYVGLAQVHGALGEVDAALERLRQAAAVDGTVTAPLLQMASLHLQRNQPAEAEAALRAALERSPRDVVVRRASAHYYRARGLPERALEEWRLAVEQIPTSIEALAGLAEELARHGRRSEAQQMLRRAEALDPNAAEARSVALAYATLGDAEAAREWFRRALAAAPADPATWLARGRFHARLGDVEAALPCLEEATRLAPAQGEAWTRLGETLMAAGRTEEAVDALERALTVEPTYLPAYEPLMRAHLALEEPLEARRVVDAAQAVAPGSHETNLLTAAHAESRGDVDVARAALQEAIDRAPGMSEPYLRSTDLLTRQGRFAEAVAVGGEATRIWPADSRLIVMTARADAAQGQVQRAIARLEAVTHVSAREPAPWLELATLYREQNRPADAEALLRRATLELHDPAVRLELADLYASLARPDDALEELRRAAEEHPDAPETLLAYADALRLRGETGAAKALYERAEGVGASEAPAVRRIAAACDARGRRDDALAWLQRAVARWPTDPANWLSLGRALARLGRTDEALSALRRATQLDPTEGETWHALGTALLEAGRDDEAIAALQHAVRVEPAYLPSYGALVDAYLARDRLADAEHVATTARRVVPGAYQGGLYLARVLRHQECWGEARAVLDEALAMAPGVPEPHLAMGELAWLQGQTDQAVAQYELAVAVRPGQPEAAIALTDVLLHLGENERALAVARRGVEAAPGIAALLLQQGRAERALGRFADAEATLLRAVAADPLAASAHVELGDVRLSQGRPKEAILDYERASAAEPDSADHYLALSQLWVTQGRADVALAVLHEGATRAEEAGRLQAAASLLRLRQGDAAGALDTLQQGLSGGEDAELLVALGAHYETQADYARAQESYQRAVALAPDEPLGHIALADLHLRAGRPGEALAGYRRAIDLDPRDPSLHLALGDALRLTGDLAGAATCYAQALRLSPTLIEAYCSLGSLYEAQARWAEAEALYEEGLSLAPASGRLLIQYGGLMVQRGEIDRATALLEQAREVSPRAETFVARAILYRLVGRTAEAQQELEAAAQVEPGSLEALIALGDLYLAKGATGEAAQLYRQAVALAPGAAEGHLGLANLALHQGNLGEAWRAFDAALRVQPAEADPWVQLAQARADVDDLTGAEAAYRRAVDVAPLVSRAYAGLALVTQRRTGDRSQALSWLDRARRLGVDPALIERTAGQVYLRAGQSSQALAHFQAAVQQGAVLPNLLTPATRPEPASPEGHLALAAYQLARGLPYAALEAVRAAEAIAPRDAQVQLTYGDIYRALWQTPLADQRYRCAAALDATRPDGYLSLATMLAAEGRHADALAAYQQAAGRAPLDPTPLIGMGDVYADRGEHDAALGAYGRAAALNPSLPDPWLRRGDVLLDRGDVPGAVEAYRRANAVRPYSAQALLRLAGLYVEQGDLAQAEVHARQALAADRRDAEAHVQLASILARLERREEAIASYLAAVQIDSRQMDAYERWVRLHEDILERPFRIDLGRLEQALSALEAGQERHTLWGRVLLACGYHRLEGPSDRVKGYLEEAIAVDPAFAELYRQLALLHEERLEGRPAVEAWSRYRYAAALEGDVAEATAHLDALLRGRIVSPAHGSQVSGVVEVAGTAARDGLAYFKVEYRAPGTEGWHVIGEPIHMPVDGGTLVTWDTVGLPPGEYRLRLTIVDQTGNYGPHDEISVTVGG